MKLSQAATEEIMGKARVLEEKKALEAVVVYKKEKKAGKLRRLKSPKGLLLRSRLGRFLGFPHP